MKVLLRVISTIQIEEQEDLDIMNRALNNRYKKAGKTNTYIHVKNPLNIKGFRKHETGFEPAALALARRCSTTEPLVRIYNYWRPSTRLKT